MAEMTVRCPLGCSTDYLAWNGVKGNLEHFVCTNCHRRWSIPYTGPDPTAPPNRYPPDDHDEWITDLAVGIGDRITAALRGRWPR